MKPPALRNFVPLERNADRPRPPKFYQAQPRFTPAGVSQFKAVPQKYTPFGSIPQQPIAQQSLPLREVNDFRKRLKLRGNGSHYDRSTVAAKPPRAQLNDNGNDPKGYGNRPGRAPIRGPTFGV